MTSRSNVDRSIALGACIILDKVPDPVRSISCFEWTWFFWKFGSFQLLFRPTYRLDTSIVSFFNGIGAFHCRSFSPRNAFAVDVSRSQSACSKRSPQYLTRDWRVLRRLCCATCASDIEVDHYLPSSNHLSVSHLEASKVDAISTSSERAFRTLPPCTAGRSWIVKVKSFTAFGYEEM